MVVVVVVSNGSKYVFLFLHRRQIKISIQLMTPLQKLTTGTTKWLRTTCHLNRRQRRLVKRPPPQNITNHIVLHRQGMAPIRMKTSKIQTEKDIPKDWNNSCLWDDCWSCGVLCCFQKAVKEDPGKAAGDVGEEVKEEASTEQPVVEQSA